MLLPPGEWFLTFQTYVVPSCERVKMSQTRWHSYLGMVSPARDWLGMWRANWGHVVMHSFRKSVTTRPMTWCHITKTVNPKKKMRLEPQFPTIPFWNPSFTTTSHLILLRTYNYTVLIFWNQMPSPLANSFIPAYTWTSNTTLSNAST